MSNNADKTRTDGMPVGTPFTSDYQPEGRGRPKGSISLQTRIQRLMNGDEPLPAAIEETIKNAVGEGKKPIDAVVIVALLQSLQGEKQWADWLANNGYEKPTEKSDVNLSGNLTVVRQFYGDKESTD